MTATFTSQNAVQNATASNRGGRAGKVGGPDKNDGDIDAVKIRNDFPILSVQIHQKPLIYVDNAATTQKPQCVIAAVKEYYETYNSNVHRSVHTLSELATAAYEKARRKVARFINANPDEIVFTKGTTESLNLLAYSLSDTLHKGDEVVLSVMEHHSNLVPWQQMAKQKGFVLKFIAITTEGRLDMQDVREKITSKTKIVSITHGSNVLGTINPVKDLCRMAHAVGALCIIDAAQSAPHIQIDVKDMDCDFLAFSGHKMLAPMGIGVFFGQKKHLARMRPFLYGGNMILEVSLHESSWNDAPMKFEAGTPNVAGAVGLAAAIEYLEALDMQRVALYEQELCAYALQKLSAISGMRIIGPANAKDRLGVISFEIDGIHSHDVSTLLDREGIAVRGGSHCAQPLMGHFRITGATRISLYVYNTKEEIDRVCNAIQKAKKVFA